MRGTGKVGAIEIATLAHAALLAAIHRAAFPPAEAWSRDVITLQLSLPTTFGLFISSGGLILGRIAADESEVLTLAVDPARRRLGLGSALLRGAMDRAASLGATSMFLEVAVTNHAALAVYAAHGFIDAGRRRQYYSDGTDALVLRSTLPSVPRPGLPPGRAGP
ncbi:MAG: GNAT family N-acetyltransferase [Acetobacteraceae bacterium]|nr:GNAT family N-acetyltransferase [Acetobacteraceae bacterium]